jgi:hypothetical protein
MRNCCAANQFSGCCEGGECTSYAARIGKTVEAKRFSFSLLEAVTVAFYIAVVIGCGITLDNHFKRQALIEQEQVAWH